MSTSEEEATSEPVATPRIRGVKTGTIAKANGVATVTAYGWFRRSEDEPKQRGGRRNVKVNDA